MERSYAMCVINSFNLALYTQPLACVMLFSSPVETRVRPSPLLNLRERCSRQTSERYELRPRFCLGAPPVGADGSTSPE